MIYDKIEQHHIYPYGEVWMLAFDFLKSLNHDSEEKRYDLADGVYAEVSSYTTKNQTKAVLESHQKYLDIQAALRCSEIIECFSSHELTIKERYCPKRDVQFYEYPGKPNIVITNSPGYFTALWPNDAHMPLLKAFDDLTIKKVVVKIPINLLLPKL